MLPGPPEDYCWPGPWRPVAESEAATEVIAPQPFAPAPASFTFEAELQHEVCPGHSLHGVECRAVARSREHPDEFVFVTADPLLPIAFVHLTWTVESDPAFPYTVGYLSWEAFRSAWVEADA
jgi:hypothetical protein